MRHSVHYESVQIRIVIAMMLLAAIVVRAEAPATTASPPAPRLSKFDALAARTGTTFKREYIPIPSASADEIRASVVRLEDTTTHEVVLSLQVELPDNRGIVCASEEEMPALKDAVASIMANIGKLGTSKNPVDVEYRAISSASFGYCVHRIIPSGEELPATAYVELPINPAIPQIGGLQRLSPQLLQKMVTEAQAIMDKLNSGG